MSKPSKPPKKHHYVTQAQLRHFARDDDHKQVHVFDKTTGRSFTSSILNAGSENDFNTIIEDDERFNFEEMFDKVDAAGATIVAHIAERRSLSWMREKHSAGCPSMIWAIWPYQHGLVSEVILLTFGLGSRAQRDLHSDQLSHWDGPADSAVRDGSVFAKSSSAICATPATAWKATRSARLQVDRMFGGVETGR